MNNDERDSMLRTVIMMALADSDDHKATRAHQALSAIGPVSWRALLKTIRQGIASAEALEAQSANARDNVQTIDASAERQLREQLVPVVAMSLYTYNVAPGLRLRRLLDAMQRDDLPRKHSEAVESRHWATEMPMRLAKVYLSHALDVYGDEARQRIEVNLSSLFAAQGD